MDNEIRQQIDTVDNEIVALLEERVKISNSGKCL